MKINPQAKIEDEEINGYLICKICGALRKSNAVTFTELSKFPAMSGADLTPLNKLKEEGLK